MAEPEHNIIQFTLIHLGEEFQIRTSRNRYLSLMSLIADQLDILGFGLCCGMGSCGTCIVKIDGMTAFSCDIAVNDELANTRVTIVEESRF